MKNHTQLLYNTLLTLSRNVFFYKKLNLPDTFETRIYLMFFHFSIMMIVSKNKGKKFDQISYDYLFQNIENNLRELGFGDVSVNKKMKELNKILYDILLKIKEVDKDQFNINKNLIYKYFNNINEPKSSKIKDFEIYLKKFYQFCFELPLENMIREAINFKDKYGSS